MTHQKTSPASTAMPSEAKDQNHHQDCTTPPRPWSSLTIDDLRERRDSRKREARAALLCGDYKAAKDAAGWAWFYDERIKRREERA